MNKTSFEKFGKYLREVSVVVIGVAITLSVSYWLTGRNDKRDTALYLSAIKLELEENKKIFDHTNQSVIQPGLKYANYLKTHDKKSLNLDSLKLYYPQTAYEASPITFKTNAFDMFKTSGNMRLVSDKELLLSIWDTYSLLVEIKGVFDYFSDIKLEEMKKYFTTYGQIPSDKDVLNHPPLYDVYVDMPISFIQSRSYESAVPSLEKTISMLEQAK
ncbi:MAG: hypothetical protein LBE91_09320 [Tannerella sp.]|jgi:hypothetical protein|nr:hypothetical protein [Tannerella sp.]